MRIDYVEKYGKRNPAENFIMRPSEQPDWTHEQALLLAKQPGFHPHPTFKGFYIEVSPKGKAVFRVRYRDYLGKDTTKTIGEVARVGDGATSFSLRQALARATTLRETDRTPPSERLTLNGVFEEYLKNRRTKDGEPLAERTIKDYRKKYNGYLKDEAGDWLLADTKADEWLKLLRRISERSPAQANGCKQVISGIYSYLIMLDKLETNPIAKVNKTREILPPPKRKGKLHALDLPGFALALNGLRNKHSACALRVILLTGMRHSATMQMRWEHLNLGDGYYNVPPRAPGWKRFKGPFAFSDLVLALLQERQDNGGPAYSPWVFYGRHGEAAKGHMESVRESLKKACEGLAYRITEHDLRRTFATLANIALNDNARLVGKLLGHAWTYENKEDASGLHTTLGYVIGEIAEARAAANTVACFIAEVSGMLPLSDESADLLRKRGIDPAKLEPVELADDEDE